MAWLGPGAAAMLRCAALVESAVMRSGVPIEGVAAATSCFPHTDLPLTSSQICTLGTRFSSLEQAKVTVDASEAETTMATYMRLAVRTGASHSIGRLHLDGALASHITDLQGKNRCMMFV